MNAISLCLTAGASALTIVAGPLASQPPRVQPELVQVRTEDGVLLSGAFWMPQGRARETGIVLQAGSGSEFYDLTKWGDAFAAAGYRVVALNRRDHGDRFGFEPFEKAAMDVRYAVDLIAQRGAGRVVLVGHSYGTAIVPYYVATAADSRVAAAILLAAIADFRAASARLLGQATYDAAVSAARQKLSEGKGSEAYLMPLPVSAGALALMSYDVFLNKRGPDSKAVPATLLQTVNLPILAVRDPADPFPGTLPPAQQQLLAANKRLEYVLLPDTRDGRMDPAAHGFVGRETAVMTLLLEWLAKHGM